MDTSGTVLARFGASSSPALKLTSPFGNANDATGVYIAAADVAKMAAAAVREHRKSAPGGCIHACEFETSLMLHFGYDIDMSLAPKEPFVSPSRFFPADGFAGGKAAFWSTWGVQRSASGAYGDATVASAESGARFFEGLVSAFVDFARDFYAGPVADWGRQG